ncbi:DNA-binding transcriptional regulator, LysR family [Oscillospiraceae bacterium]|nr:DNA-binding transcriptional regulator, LysR family [Oscillospiraceae bacterium]
MTLTQLRTFLEIAESGSFTSAADKMGYAQSTVTMQIRSLEEELGTPLFDRLGKTVVPTDQGIRLMAYAEKMLQMEREIKSDITSSEKPSGLLKIGVSETLCYKRFPEMLLWYRNSFPEVEIQLTFVTHDTFPGMLRSGAVDMVYTLNPLIERDDLKLLSKKEESLGFYVSPDHKLAKKRRVTESDLNDIPLLLTSHGCNFRKMLIEALNEEGIIPNIAIETSSKEILKQFAINGAGAAFIPDMSAQDEVIEGKLTRLNWKGAKFPIYSQVFVHKDKHITGAIREMADLITGYR